MTLRCGILDDEPIARKVLMQHINQIPTIELVFEIGDPLKLVDKLNQYPVDLLFLDVEMPTISGIEVAQMIGELPVQIIFVTAYPEYAVKGFELAAIDYLVKPVSFDRFFKAVSRVTKKVSEQSSHISFKSDGKLVRLALKDIIYIQAFGDYIRLYTDVTKYLIKDTLTHFLKKLPNTFIRVHRSYVVSMEHFEYLKGNNLSVSGTIIPVSNSGMEKLKKNIHD